MTLDVLELEEQTQTVVENPVFSTALLFTIRQGLLVIVDGIERRMIELGETVTRTAELRKELHRLKEEARHSTRV